MDTCRGCGCDDLDCSDCIERTGAPCWWAEPGLCSACAAEGLTGAAAMLAEAGVFVSAAPPVELAADKDGAPPEWITLFPATSEIRARDGRWWKLPDPEAMVRTTLRRMADTDLVVDYGHAAEHARHRGGEAPAAGWIRALRVVAGAVQARVEWTARAAAAIAAREYRYLSPAFHRRGSDRGGEVLEIVSVALTSTPALDLPALAREGGGGESMPPEIVRLLKDLGVAADADAKAVDAALARWRAGETAAADRTALAAALGQPETAGRKALEAAIAALRPDPGQHVPRAEFERVSTALATLQKERADERATAAVDAATAAGKVTPAMRDWALKYAREKPDDFRAYVAGAPVIVQAAGDPPAAGGEKDGAALTATEVGDAPVLPRSVFGHGRLPGEGLSWRATLTPEAVPLTRIAGLIVLGGGLLQVRRQGASFVDERGPGALVEPDEWPRSGGLEMAWRPDPETPGDTLTLTAVHETHVAGLAWLPVGLPGGASRVVSRGELGTGAITLMRPAGDHTQTKLVSVSPSTAPVEHRAGSAGPWVRGVPADAALTGTALSAAPVHVRFRAA